jgi:hypothetical protein
MRWAFLFWFLLFMAAPVSAGEPPSFQELWDAVAHDPDCKPSQFPDFVLFTCERQYTFWYLTKPNHPAHPGIIKRYLYQQDGAWYAKEEDAPLPPMLHSQPSRRGSPRLLTWIGRRGNGSKNSTAKSPTANASTRQRSKIVGNLIA